MARKKISQGKACNRVVAVHRFNVDLVAVAMEWAVLKSGSVYEIEDGLALEKLADIIGL